LSSPFVRAFLLVAYGDEVEDAQLPVGLRNPDEVAGLDVDGVAALARFGTVGPVQLVAEHVPSVPGEVAGDDAQWDRVREQIDRVDVLFADALERTFRAD
jgi:hypothetical protein